ncbi:MAG: hypothetical protein WBB08_07735 [Halobacteriota archaeon]
MGKIAPILIVLIAIAVVTGSVYGQDLNEPNNEIGDATAITFNQTVNSYISPAGDVDYYKFYVDSSGIMQIKLDNVPSDMRVRIDLYDKNGRWITRKDATNAGDTLTFEKDIGGPGWYYIAISDLEGKEHAAEYSFKFTFEPAVDLNEPNSVVGDATEIEFNQTVRGYICPAGDQDYCKFYVNSSGIMQIKLDNVPSDMRTRIDLWGKNFNWITRKDATNAGDTLTFEKDIGGPGWYYLAISDLEGKAHAAEYSFKFSFEPAADLNELNSVVGDATEIEFNQTVRGYICPAHDADYYKFYVNSSGIMQIKLDNVPSDMRTRIDLWGKNFKWITRKDATNAGDTLTFEKDIGGPGWYYIAISDLEGKAHAAEYSFKFTFEPAVDLNEPNSVVGDATEVEFDQTVRGYICPAGDVDYYKFHVNNPGILQVKLDNVPSDMRARIDLYGKSFKWITRKDASNAGDTVILEKDLVNPGWYYVAISDLDRQAHSEEYTFRVLLT